MVRRLALVLLLGIFAPMHLAEAEVPAADGVSRGEATAAEAQRAADLAAQSWEHDPLFDDEEGEEAALHGFPDPLESMNRGVFGFNASLDRWLFGPLTKGYQFFVPDPIRLALRRVLTNLDAFPIMINDGFQLEWLDAGTTTVRFIINSTVGLGGLFDPAVHLGLEHHRSDFGQTLTLAGVASGPYLIVPVMGPTNLRDGTGVVVDTFLRPATYFIGPFYLLLYGGTAGLATRDEQAESIKALRESSVDYYAAMRSAYYQDRMAKIWNRRESRRPKPKAPESP